MRLCIGFIALIAIVAPAANALAHGIHTFDIVSGHSHNIEFAIITLIGTAVFFLLATILWSRGR
ncbi:MAG: hypothetical protein HRT83_02335 [Hyphomicrobiaceae bacterium]|nr:hypothetical protein [Hyphomicrobiaceae bacterium]